MPLIVAEGCFLVILDLSNAVEVGHSFHRTILQIVKLALFSKEPAALRDNQNPASQNACL